MIIHSLLEPLPEQRFPTTPLGDILHELDLVATYMREYKVEAIARHVQDPVKWPKIGFDFDLWKRCKSIY